MSGATTSWLISRKSPARLPGGERRVPLDVQIISTTKGTRLHPQEDLVRHRAGRPRAGLAADSGSDAEAAPRKRPAVLCLHQTIAIGKDEPAGLGQNRELAYARELAERGYVTLAPDYPNFGEYKLNVYDLGYASATMKAIWNNLRAIDLLCSLDEVDPTRIGVIGHSLGGHNAIFTALFDDRIKAVVSSCGFNAFPSYYKGNIAGWSHQGYMPRLRARYGLDLKKVPFDFPELIAALAPRAFFTNSPLHDANFEVEGVRACITAAQPVYELAAMPPIAWSRSIPTPSILSQSSPPRSLSFPGSHSGTTFLTRLALGPKCLTKKEMSVVYDTATSAHGLRMTSRRDTEKDG